MQVPFLPDRIAASVSTVLCGSTNMMVIQVIDAVKMMAMRRFGTFTILVKIRTMLDWRFVVRVLRSNLWI
jgi:hypothetical protein